MEHINLIRDLAWKFAQKSHLEYDELFSEASLAYCEAMEKFDSSRGAKFTTFAYMHIHNMLVNFCIKETRISSRNLLEGDFPEHIHPTTEQQPVDVYDIIEQWPEDCREVAFMVLEFPEKYLGETPNYRRRYVGPVRRIKKVEKDLERKGWFPSRIHQAIKGIQSQLKVA